MYALLDPRTQIPFYVGKGTSNRVVGHFFGVGEKPEDIVNKSKNQGESEKLRTIRELNALGHKSQDIARVLARNISEDVAFTLEGILIKSIYGRSPSGLKNIKDGQHTERFRDKMNWDHINGYDLSTDSNGNFLQDNGKHLSGKFYVYVLRHPETGRIFYIGKGKGKRLCDHFDNAKSNTIGKEIDRLDEIRGLFMANYQPRDVGRIVARVKSEMIAFMIESFYIKSLVGFKNLHNIQPGHLSGLFRSYGDWQLRIGFDIPLVVQKGQPRDELKDIFLGEGLDIELQEVIDNIAEREPKHCLAFSPVKVVGAGELAVLANIPGVHPDVFLRIQIRAARRIQVMLQPKGRLGEKWVKDHFTRLSAYPLKRKDNMFIAQPWWGLKVTSSVAVAADRALELIKLSTILRREDLGSLESLLEGLPHQS